MSLILLTLMVLTVAWSIEAAEWAPGLSALQGIILLAVMLSFVFSELPVPGFVVHGLSLVAGVGWSLFLVGRQLDPGSITHRLILTGEDLTWRVRLTELAYRVRAFVEIVRSGGVGSDNLVFVLQMAVLIWLVGYASTWFLFRARSVWGAIIPSGFAMLLNLYYAPPELYVWMAVYVLCALLLIIRSNVFLQQWEWRQAGVRYSPDIGYDFLWNGAVFAAIVVVLAWLAPTTSAAPRLDAIVDYLNEPIYRFQREFNRLYSSLNYRPQPGPAYFGDTMALLGPVNLGDAPVFDAVTTKGRYWRGVVYDEYTGRGWVNTATSITSIAANDPRLNAIQYKLREPVTQTIRVLQPGTVQLHLLPQPIDVNLPARAQYSTIDGVSDIGVVPLNVSILQSRRPLKAGDTYRAVSSLSVADVQSLREAGTNYPEWVVRTYLQLPDDLPQRVRDLAAEITAGQDNAYDQVSAIEAYLRKIKYDEQIPAPPPGVDGVDWFLFEEQAGYCDYYASALVVMARTLGIPARIAAGYSLGDYDREIGAYRQREYDAHSWPEVFFPEYGWVEFEPTAADPRIVRPTAQQSADSTSDTSGGANERDSLEELLPDEDQLDPEIGGGNPLPGLAQGSLGWLMRGVVVLLTILLAVAVARWLLWVRAFQGLSLARGTYARMARLAGWLGYPAVPTQTPHEYAGQLAGAIPEGRPAIGQITDAYVLELFADESLEEEEASVLHDSWVSLRRMLIERVGLSLIQRITGQPPSPPAI